MDYQRFALWIQTDNLVVTTSYYSQSTTNSAEEFGNDDGSFRSLQDEEWTSLWPHAGNEIHPSDGDTTVDPTVDKCNARKSMPIPPMHNQRRLKNQTLAAR